MSGVATRIEEALWPALGGQLPVRLRAWDGSTAGAEEAPQVELRSPRALRRLLWHPGELGAAQAYVTGELDVRGDLAGALLHVRRQVAGRPLGRSAASPSALRSLLQLSRATGAVGRPLPPPATQAALRGRLHSMRRDRDAISHHYDQPARLFELILDPSMAYSCGYWRDGGGGTRHSYGLADAQRDKLDLVCRKVGLDRPGLRLLDVGCGWGSLALHAAESFGARVTAVTIAEEQGQIVQQRIDQRGLGDRVEVRLQDYREVTGGPFDAVASLEMGEHVGSRNYRAYVAALHTHLRPGGRALVQQMSRRGRHRGGGPFIEAFIAPDMHMRPVGQTIELLEAGGLELVGAVAMGAHYVRTIAAWEHNLAAHWDEVVELVGHESARVWRLYLAGARLAFADGRMNVHQLLTKRR